MKKSYFKGAEVPELIDETIGQCFDRIAERFPDRPALVSRHQGIRWNYAEYSEAINKLAAGFLALGIEPGDRVGIWSPNGYEWCLTQFASAKIGAILVCINPAYRVFELEYAINKSGCKAIVAAEKFKSSHYLEMLQRLAPELMHSEPGKLNSDKFPALKIVIRMGQELSPGMFNFDDISGRGSEINVSRMQDIENDTS
jgi:fatty-acyl-CoA synthase